MSAATAGAPQGQRITCGLLSIAILLRLRLLLRLLLLLLLVLVGRVPLQQRRWIRGTLAIFVRLSCPSALEGLISGLPVMAHLLRLASILAGLSVALLARVALLRIALLLGVALLLLIHRDACRRLQGALQGLGWMNGLVCGPATG